MGGGDTSVCVGGMQECVWGRWGGGGDVSMCVCEMFRKESVCVLEK